MHVEQDYAVVVSLQTSVWCPSMPCCTTAEDEQPHAGNRVELEAIHDQLYRKHQTAQMAMLTAHKERVEWDHDGGPPPVHSHYGQVCHSTNSPLEDFCQLPFRPFPANYPFAPVC